MADGRDARLAALGLELPPPMVPKANFVSYCRVGDLVYLSGVGPWRPDGSFVAGHVGATLSEAEGYEAAKLCGVNLISTLRAALGSLDRVERIVKVLGLVAAPASFTGHSTVIDGCTDLFVAVFGDAGRPARSAIGVASLPRGFAVEIEAIAQVRGGAPP